jgi:hypothetical protein
MVTEAKAWRERKLEENHGPGGEELLADVGRVLLGNSGGIWGFFDGNLTIVSLSTDKNKESAGSLRSFRD